MSLICLPNISFPDIAKADFSPTLLNSNFKLVASELMGFYGTGVLNSGDSIMPMSKTPQVFAENRKNRVLFVPVLHCRQ